MSRIDCRWSVLDNIEGQQCERLKHALHRLHEVMERWDEFSPCERAATRQYILYLRQGPFDHANHGLAIDQVHSNLGRGEERAGRNNGVMLVLNVQIVEPS